MLPVVTRRSKPMDYLSSSGDDHMRLNRDLTDRAWRPSSMKGTVFRTSRRTCSPGTAVRAPMCPSQHRGRTTPRSIGQASSSTRKTRGETRSCNSSNRSSQVANQSASRISHPGIGSPHRQSSGTSTNSPLLRCTKLPGTSPPPYALSLPWMSVPHFGQMTLHPMSRRGRGLRP